MRRESRSDTSSPRLSSRNSQLQEAPTGIKDESKSSNIIQRKPVKIVVENMTSVALSADGQQSVTGDENGKVRCWRMEDGEETGAPMDAKSAVRCLAASQDGKWITAGTTSGRVVVWDAESRKALRWFTRGKGVDSVDISSDGTKIAIAWDDKNVGVNSLPDGKRLWGRVNCDFHTVKLSPDGSLLAYDTGKKFEIHNSQDGQFIGGVRVSLRSVAWTSDSKQVFALSSDGNIHCVDASNAKTLSKWPIHSTDNPTCISLSSNGAFIAASANSSVSFWDTFTYEQIGTVISHPHVIDSMAICQNIDLLVGGSSGITLCDLHAALSTACVDHQLAEGQQTTRQKEDILNKTIDSLRADIEAQNVKSVVLEKTVEELRTELASSQQKHGEDIKKLETTIQRLRAQLSDNAKKSSIELAKSQQNVKDLEATIQQFRTELSNSRQNANTTLSSSQQVIRVHQRMHRCEILYADGHVIDAAQALLDITDSMTDDVKSDVIIMDWLSVFTIQCIATLEHIGDEASQTGKHDEALAAYAVALSLSPSSPNPFLHKWISAVLLHGSTNKILDGARQLNLPKLAVYRATCDILEGDGRVMEAIGCFREMQSEPPQDNGADDERATWKPNFQQRCTERLEKLGDAALGSQNYDEADKYYSTILSLDQPDRAHTLIKRSHTRAMMESWEDALTDADKAIELNPSSHQGYECRYAALHGARRHAEAVSAFDTMLLKLQESPDPRVRRLCSRYQDARPIVRRTIRATISHMPRVLIDTTTGRLCDRAQQVKTFEALPVFNELVSSMTREIDHTWIRREVNEFCKYVMFSHRWEEHGEPLFQTVVHVTVYELEASRGNIKLQTFCSIVRALGFRWAWSDTCCIDKSDNVVLQESLVAMFAWYRGSSLTIIHLLGVSSLAEALDALRNSIWNSRVWTHQEYVAAKRVLFYTEDWKPYLGLTLENHKESPAILREMEMSEVSSEQVAVLRPGLDRIREKLYLASTRETTLVEDIAYSLLGILNVSIPIIYGEGSRAVGRLLEFVLAGSGDATILAWTGTANEYNSCLPLNLTVYNPLVPPHIPRMETAELDHAVSKLRTSLPDISLAVTLYHELNKLPPPTVASSRLRLPGIVSPLTNVSTSGLTYHATTDLFGDIEIETTSDLVMMNGLCLAHPWIHPLLDQEFTRGSARLDLTTRALQLVARLQQSFGALLFEQVSRTEYKRVAADRFIMVQFCKEVSLTDLISNIRTIEVP